MLKLFQFLFYGCAHKWEDTSESKFEIVMPSNNKVVESGPIVYSRCVRCGKHTYFKNATMK